MLSNPTLDLLMNRKSIRKYKPEQPGQEIIETIVRAGQQAPFAYQLGSLLLSRNIQKNPFHAPLLFTVCVDSHRFEMIMECRGWKKAANDLSLLVLGIQDAALMAENMVIAAESLGLGSCFLGAAPYYAGDTIKAYNLPPRVFPLVGLAMGYPAENPPVRPRYPQEFTLFEDRYPHFDQSTLHNAMKAMDDGYLAQDYYIRANYMIPLDGERQESYTFQNYSWTEHISRKIGQWQKSSKGILAAFRKCGFTIPRERS
jgi:nitroreductase